MSIPKKLQRDIFTTCPPTKRKNSSLTRVTFEKKVLLGSPSALTRYTGNPYEVMNDLSSSVYYHLGIRDGVEVTMARWNEEKDATEWPVTTVMPSDRYLRHLWTWSAAELFLWKFPADSKYRQRPPGTKDMDWNNHLNSLLGIICGLKKFFVDESTFFTDLM